MLEAQTVTELTDYIKHLFDDDPELVDVWVKGELSGCHRATSGHWYWTVKDDEAQLSCVMWKYQAANQTCEPEEGGEFLLHGAVSVYAARGQYQLYVDHIEPLGVGDLFREFERLKAKLEAEGLFEAERKRPLPAYPRRIGVVTSPDAAALRDVCHVLARRWAGAEVYVAPTLVQGDRAPDGIVAAFETMARSEVEVVIVTRGGGSIEDLWAFNDERVARAIAACPVPVISGVGHETDFTIADFVADQRAPTPSAAAEVATPDGRELALAVDELRERLERTLRWRLDGAAETVRQLAGRLRLASPRRALVLQRQTVDGLRRDLERAVAVRLRQEAQAVDGLARRLGALSPVATLERGYAHVSRRADGAPVRSADDVGPGDGVRVRVHDGGFDAVVEGQGRLL